MNAMAIWAFVALNALTRVTDFEGVSTRYEYDAQDRLKRATVAEGATEYTYFGDGLEKTRQAFNGMYEGRCYDEAGRLSALVTARTTVADGCAPPAYVSRYRYGYDGEGNRVTQDEELTSAGGVAAGPSERTAYGYDEESRLVGVRYPDETVALYQLDAVGNRVGERKAPSSAVASLTMAAFLAVSPGALTHDVVAVFNGADWLKSVTDTKAAEKNASFEWDAAGNLKRQVSGGKERHFDWDVKQTLTRVTDDGVEVGRYDYGATGLRSKRVTASESVEYVLDGMEVLVETDGASVNHAAKRRYHYGTAALAVTDIAASRTTRVLHLDALGSPGTETTAGAQVSVVRQYDAWGVYRNGTAPVSGDAKLGYTGHQYDVETGLVYARARYYDAEYGRFLSRDSNEGAVNSAPSLHRFTYAHSNPLRYRDPTGRDALAWAKYVLGLGPPPPVAIDSCSASGRVCSEKAAEATNSASRATEAAKQFNSAQPLSNIQAPVGAVPAPTAAPGVGAGVTAGVLKVAYDFFARDARNREYETDRQKAQSGVDESIRRACAQGGNCEGITLPTAEERQGVVIEDPSTGNTALLPGQQKAPMVDDMERMVIADPQAEDEALLGPMYRGKPVSPQNPDYGSGKGRRGSLETRKEIDRIRDEFLKKNPEWEHTRGGTDQETGMKLPEEYLPGPQGAKGSSYVDLTFQSPTGELVRINTVDVDLNRPSQMSEREEINRDLIWWQDPETPIVTIPKGTK